MKTIKKKLSSFNQETQDAIIKLIGQGWIGLYKEEISMSKSDKLDLILDRLDTIESKVDKNSSNIEAMMNTPTMKRELAK